MKNDNWFRIADTKQKRHYVACTVFEGKIVVTGGKYSTSYRKSVEAFDHHENKWTYLPDMIEERHYHASVSMGNKLFVIGEEQTTSCEVFDSFSRKFTLLEAQLPEFNANWSFIYNAVNIGSIIYVLS